MVDNAPPPISPEQPARPDGEHLFQTGQRRLVLALLLIASFMVAEIVGGILSGSLALIADATHMATDAGSIMLALIAMHFAQKAATAEHTYGYKRMEILAALANVIALWVIVVMILIEAWNRFQSVPEVQGGTVLAIGILGLLVNIAAAWILRESAQHSVNVEGAFQHVLADLLGSIGVVVSGCLIWWFGWTLADPIVTLVIALLILHGSWGLLTKVVHVLLEGVPPHIDIIELRTLVEEIDGVASIHDLHVWTLSPGNEALTTHVLLDQQYHHDSDKVLRAVRSLLRDKYGIEHLTIQIDKTMAECLEGSSSRSFLLANELPRDRGLHTSETI